jgi:hypothetical protein
VNPGVIGGNPVTVSVISAVTPGMVTSSTLISPRVDGEWSPMVSFSTLQKPVITGPIGIDSPDPNAPRTITDLRPTLTWTAIDRAARYDVWVERSASTSTYLRTTSSVNSYQFESDLLSGNYTVRVRAVSTTGQLTEWSELFAFTSTGGASIVLSATVTPTRFATITWAPVADAVSYEVQIAWIGTNIDHLHPTGITVQSYTTTSALSPGSYRAWVRGVKADGTLLNWSKPFDFTVVSADAVSPESQEGDMLVVLESALAVEKSVPVQSEGPAAAHSEQADDFVESAPVGITETVAIATPESAPANPGYSVNGEEALLIEHLAEACANQEWWTVAGLASA